MTNAPVFLFVVPGGRILMDERVPGDGICIAGGYSHTLLPAVRATARIEGDAYVVPGMVEALDLFAAMTALAAYSRLVLSHLSAHHARYASAGGAS
jgi:hypothetical protein